MILGIPNLSKDKDKETVLFFFFFYFLHIIIKVRSKHLSTEIQISSLFLMFFYIFPRSTSRLDHLLLCEYIMQIDAFETLFLWYTWQEFSLSHPTPVLLCEHSTHLSDFRSGPITSPFPFLLCSLDLDIPIAVRSASSVWHLFESLSSYDFLSRKFGCYIIFMGIELLVNLPIVLRIFSYLSLPMESKCLQLCFVIW